MSIEKKLRAEEAALVVVDSLVRMFPGLLDGEQEIEGAKLTEHFTALLDHRMMGELRSYLQESQEQESGELGRQI